MGSGVARAQLSDTTAFLADVSNQYRVVPNVVYHVANNHDNKLDLYLPANPSGSTPVLMMIHGGGWVQGTKEAQVLRALPYLEMGWAVVTRWLVKEADLPMIATQLGIEASQQTTE